jgi:RecB family exonuclease
MAVNVFYAPFGHRGSTGELLKEAIKGREGPDYSDMLYVAPTSLKVREAQRVFHGLVRGCYMPPYMTTLRQISRRLCSTYGDRFILPGTLIPVLISKLTKGDIGLGFSVIISEFIREMKHLYPLESVGAVRERLLKKFDELSVPEEVVKRASLALDIYEKYQDTLERQGAIDEDDALSLSAGFGEKLRSASLILDGFYELDEAEKGLARALIGNSDNTFISINKSDDYTEITNGYIDYLNNNFIIKESIFPVEKINSGGFFYHPFPSLEEEAEGMARHIKANYISGRLRDLSGVSVVYPAIKPVRNMLERVFIRYGIPYCFQAAKTAIESRSYRDIIRLLESVSGDYPRLSYSGALASPYFINIPKPLKDAVPKISLSSALVKGESSWLKTIDENDGLKELKKPFKKVLKKLNVLNNKTTYGDIIKELHDIMNAFGFSGSADDTEGIEKAFKGLSLIEAMANGARKGRRDLRSFTESLRHIFDATAIERDDIGTGVRFIDFSGSEGIEPEFLYFAGLKDGDMPSRPGMDFILPDSVRSKIGLKSLKRHLLTQEFLFKRLINASKGLHLSYPSMEGDKFFLPSVFLDGAGEKKGGVYGVFSEEEKMLRAKSLPFTVHLKEIRKIRQRRIKARFRKGSGIRVTDIDSYRACPRRFFIEKSLGLEPPDIKEYEMEAALLGKILHKVMETLIPQGFLSEEEFKISALKALEQSLSKVQIEDYWKNLIKESFLGILPDIYKVEEGLKKEGYSFMKAELKLEGEPLKGIRLKGSIDRVDGKEGDASCVEILDYKTGSSALSGSGILKKGASLQLPLYACLLRGAGMNPLRAGIYSLKDMKITWVPGKKDKNTLKDYMDAAISYLEETVKGMRAGDFAAKPLIEQTCARCHERPYCPYIQGKDEKI